MSRGVEQFSQVETGVAGHGQSGRLPGNSTSQGRAGWRGHLRDQALQSGLRKRAEGVPTYSVPEAAALLSISQEYLYRLIQAGEFPAVRMRIGVRQGRYVVPAKAVEQMLDFVSDAGSCVDAREWTERWNAETGGGAA
jgi:excisionase family DNA binding protein